MAWRSKVFWSNQLLGDCYAHPGNITCSCVLIAGVSQHVIQMCRVLMQKVARELLTMPDGPASVKVTLFAQRMFLCVSQTGIGA